MIWVWMILLLISPLVLYVAIKVTQGVLIPILFGTYWCSGWFGRMPFLTREGAIRYRAARVDYARGMQEPITFEPGLLARREPRPSIPREVTS